LPGRSKYGAGTAKPDAVKPARPKSRFKQLILLAGVMVLFMLALIMAKPLKVDWLVKKPDLPAFQNIRYVVNEPSPYEIPLCQSMVIENWYDVRHCVVVECSMYAKAVGDRQEQLRSRVAANDSQIKDMIRATISSVHLGDIRDPALADVKGRVGQNMDQIVGSNLVEKILIPDWNAYSVYQ
jgi:hypothetical protein